MEGKRSKADCESFRAIFLADHIAKVFAGALRRELVPNVERFVGPFQFGGRRGAGVSMVLQATMAACARKGWSYAVLFTDIAQAFDACIRQVIYGARGSQTQVLNQLHALGCKAAGVEQIAAFVRAGGALAAAGVPMHIVDLVRGLHEGAWFTLRRCDSISHTDKGTRPGDHTGRGIL